MKIYKSTIRQYKSFDQLLIEIDKEISTIDFQLDLINNGALPSISSLAIVRKAASAVISVDLGKYNTFDQIDSSAQGDAVVGLARLVQLSQCMKNAEEYLFIPQQAFISSQTLRYYADNSTRFSEKTQYICQQNLEMVPVIVLLPLDIDLDQEALISDDLLPAFSRFYNFSTELTASLKKSFVAGGWADLSSAALAAGTNNDNQNKADNTKCKADANNLKRIIGQVGSKISRNNQNIILISWLVSAVGCSLLIMNGVFENWLHIIPIINVILLLTGLIIIKNMLTPELKASIKNRLKGIVKSLSGRKTENRTELISHDDENYGLALISEGLPGTPQEHEGRRAFILLDEFIVGRDDSQADLLLDNKTVGRRHARISRHEGSYFITDLGSKNGTKLDGRRLNKNEEYLLPDRCRIQFADCAFFFQNEEPLKD